jgi:2-amino-4-hydroxy-6-hydroxymethyldihydropteridine diphosphokinase
MSMSFNSPILLSLGSNLGQRKQNLGQALLKINQWVEIKKISSLYRTKPIGPQNQKDFYNLVLSGSTKLQPETLLSHLKDLEIQLGRKKTFHWGPRKIDIDILFWDNLSFQLPELTIPHPRITERRFVLEPILEIGYDLPINLYKKNLYFYINQTREQVCEKIDSAAFITRYAIQANGSPTR